MSDACDVLGFGAVAVDDILYVERFPLPDSKVPVCEKRREGGGLAGTALVAASRLGVSSGYCGVLGDGELSRFTREQLEAEGVDCSKVLFRAEARPHYSVIVVDQTTASRCILAMSDGVTPFPVEAVSDELIANCRVLFVDHTSGASGLRAAQIARQLNIPIVADIERTNAAHVPEMIEVVDHLIVSLDFGRALTRESEPSQILRALMNPQRRCCVLTDGENGCWFATPDIAMRHVPAFEVSVVDTTGCGDVFHGAYAACLARGETIENAIITASAAAAIKATQPGGRSGIPDRAALEVFLSELK